MALPTIDLAVLDGYGQHLAVDGLGLFSVTHVFGHDLPGHHVIGQDPLPALFVFQVSKEYQGPAGSLA